MRSYTELFNVHRVLGRPVAAALLRMPSGSASMLTPACRAFHSVVGATYNPTLNRTLHSVAAFGPPFHSGPKAGTPFRAG